MAQPSDLLRASTRAAGVGVFYTVHYFSMGVMPGLAGLLHDLLGPRAPTAFAAPLMLISVVAQAGLSLLERAKPRGATAT